MPEGDEKVWMDKCRLFKASDALYSKYQYGTSVLGVVGVAASRYRSEHREEKRAENPTNHLNLCPCLTLV